MQHLTKEYTIDLAVNGMPFFLQLTPHAAALALRQYTFTTFTQM
jgi:hypothetical protein